MSYMHHMARVSNSELMHTDVDVPVMNNTEYQYKVCYFYIILLPLLHTFDNDVNGHFFKTHWQLTIAKKYYIVHRYRVSRCGTLLLLISKYQL